MITHTKTISHRDINFSHKDKDFSHRGEDVSYGDRDFLHRDEGFLHRFLYQDGDFYNNPNALVMK